MALSRDTICYFSARGCTYTIIFFCIPLYLTTTVGLLDYQLPLIAGLAKKYIGLAEAGEAYSRWR